MEELEVRERGVINQRQRVNVAHAGAVEGLGEVKLVAFLVDAHAVRAKRPVEDGVLEPDLGRAAARRHAPDGRLEGVGHVEVTVLVERKVVNEERGGRIERGLKHGKKRRGIHALLSRLHIDFQDAQSFINHEEVVILAKRDAGNRVQWAGLALDGDRPLERASVHIVGEDFRRHEVAGNAEIRRSGN